ncbi:MAG: hypothetical protein NTY01_20865, partial [Verrucomicrobia bacterium]|nr:hypothetical protein [Verrucomicrobiota bacterium]
MINFSEPRFPIQSLHSLKLVGIVVLAAGFVHAGVFHIPPKGAGHVAERAKRLEAGAQSAAGFQLAEQTQQTVEDRQGMRRAAGNVE